MDSPKIDHLTERTLAQNDGSFWFLCPNCRDERTLPLTRDCTKTVCDICGAEFTAKSHLVEKDEAHFIPLAVAGKNGVRTRDGDTVIKIFSEKKGLSCVRRIALFLIGCAAGALVIWMVSKLL